MQVYAATMLDEEEVADHNAPEIILAGHEGILLSKVRDYVKNSFVWLTPLNVNAAEVDTMSIDTMNEIYSSEAPSLFIHITSDEV